MVDRGGNVAKEESHRRLREVSKLWTPLRHCVSIMDTASQFIRDSLSVTRAIPPSLQELLHPRMLPATAGVRTLPMAVHHGSRGRSTLRGGLCRALTRPA